MTADQQSTACCTSTGHGEQLIIMMLRKLEQWGADRSCPYAVAYL